MGEGTDTYFSLMHELFLEASGDWRLEAHWLMRHAQMQQKITPDILDLFPMIKGLKRIKK